MIVGDAPTEEEDEEGRLFAGEAGQLLNKMLSAIQLERKNIYITNVIPWRHPKDKKPTEEEILEFMPYLQRQIEIINPSFIYLLGSSAVKAVLSTPLDLDKLRGRWHQYKSINLNTSIKVIVSYHPTFLLKYSNYKKEAWADLQMLQKKLNEK
jgi:DNA polymerase